MIALLEWLRLAARQYLDTRRPRPPEVNPAPEPEGTTPRVCLDLVEWFEGRGEQAWVWFDLSEEEWVVEGGRFMMATPKGAPGSTWAFYFDFDPQDNDGPELEVSGLTLRQMQQLATLCLIQPDSAPGHPALLNACAAYGAGEQDAVPLTELAGLQEVVVKQLHWSTFLPGRS